MAAPHRPDHSGQALTIQRIAPSRGTGVVVACPIVQADGHLPDRYSAYHDNISPPLEWTDAPEVKAWAIVVEDPDAPREEPFLHWLVWNIPGELRGVPEGMGNAPRPASPQGVIQGRNGSGGYGWFGPRPPPGHGLHRYYFQVFALADRIEMGPDTPLHDLQNALKALTIADGETMATYEAPSRQ
jgi:Raf kinase inhibitor-like YbhB/YbcL family protein